jgi:hypothetical protein
MHMISKIAYVHSFINQSCVRAYARATNLVQCRIADADQTCAPTFTCTGTCTWPGYMSALTPHGQIN